MSHRLRFGRMLLALFLVPALPIRAGQSGKPAEEASEKAEGLKPILDYISSAWDTLTRSMSECSTIVDSKVAGKSILYVPADFPIGEKLHALEARCNIEVRPLPKVIHRLGEVDTNTFRPHGLLYLEYPYVVPGGRFNEMYGWDSYFIIRGLVRAGKIELARGMIENFFFEIEHYGAVLNANRTYYLSRSQPPFLTSMIVAVHDAQKARGKEERGWLERAYAFAVRDHNMWVAEPQMAGDTGLSRYFDFGEGPAPESLKDETDHYQKVAEYFLQHDDIGSRFLMNRQPGESADASIGALYSLKLCSLPLTMEAQRCEAVKEISLNRDYYKGDRSMRESGFDISFRFLPFGAETHHFAPVCLNSLLYKSEKDLEAISRELGRAKEAEDWGNKASARQREIVDWLWDAERGEFFDYDVPEKKRSVYEYASTFYPLWAGLATKEEAAAVRKNLDHFERPGGLLTSPYETGAQWDAPYAWAPLQLIAVEGLRRYGFEDQANRLSYAFLSNVAENFRRDGTIREKYDAVHRSAEAAVKSGYTINVIGFGWTNGVFLEFLHQLPKAEVERLGTEQGARK